MVSQGDSWKPAQIEPRAKCAKPVDGLRISKKTIIDKADSSMNAIIILCEQSGAVSKFLSEQASSGQVAILEKDELRPTKVLNSLRKLRNLKVESLYVLVRDVTKQHNSFYLKMICLLFGAKST